MTVGGQASRFSVIMDVPLIQVVDLKFLGGLHLIVDLTDRRLIFVIVLVVAVIVVIFRAAAGLTYNLF
jgi:hypothetical protein